MIRLSELAMTEIVSTVEYRHGWYNYSQGLSLESSQYKNHNEKQALFKAGWYDADIELNPIFNKGFTDGSRIN